MKRIGSFKAIGDDGRQYTVFIYTDIVDAGTFKQPNAVAEAGANELRTAGGKIVRYIQKGEYEILETELVLRSITPEAP